MRTLILVGIGGLIGSVMRFVIAYLVTKNINSSFPYGTFVVNIIGCLLIGLFYGISQRYQWFSPQLRIFLTTGLCGGVTTFSSFAYENIELLHSSNYTMFALYSISSFIVGLLAVIFGTYIIKIF